MDFKYIEPETREEVLRFLSEYGDSARVIAGSTDLVLQLKKGTKVPQYVINIKGIPGQNYIDYVENRGLKLGPLTTMSDISKSPIVTNKFSALAQAAKYLGTATVRKIATIGGNICNAAPSSETSAPLLALDARIHMMSACGQRTIGINDFFTSPGKTVLKPNEFLTEIEIPDLPLRNCSVYMNQTLRKCLDLAIVGVAVFVCLNDETITDIRIGLASVAPTPIRAVKAESFIKGKRLDDSLIDEAGLIASSEASPISDVRSSKEYRHKIIQVLLIKSLKQAVNQIKESIV